VVTEQRADLLAALQAEHGDALFRYALRHTRDRGFAEDVVQESFARAWARPASVAGSSESARAWLFTVVRNLIVDDVRSARRTRELLTDEPPERVDADRTDAVLDRMLLTDALASLSPEHRAVVVSAYYLGSSTRETAEQLGIGIATLYRKLRSYGK